PQGRDRHVHHLFVPGGGVRRHRRLLPQSRVQLGLDHGPGPSRPVLPDVTRLFLALSALTLILVGIAAAKDTTDRQYLAAQEQYQKDYPGSNFNVQVQQLRSEEHTSELQSRENLVC